MPANDHKNYRNTLLKRIGNLSTLQRKKCVTELARNGDDGLGITREKWDQQPYLLACINGVVDLQTGTLLNGKPEQYLKTVCPTEYHENAGKPEQFQRFLSDIFREDKELIEYIQRLLGCALLGKVSEHILPIFWGQGRNGKSTLFNIIGHILGPLAGPVEAELLLQQTRSRSSAGASPDLVDLRGKRIVWANETNENRKFDAGRVKWLVGGDMIVGRSLYAKNLCRFEPTHSLFLITNNKPHAPSDDFAFWQRVHLIPFTVAFVDKPREQHERKINRHLYESLTGEAQEILKWLVEGCIHYQKFGLNPPSAVLSATEEYRSEEDLLRPFIDEYCRVDSQASVQAGDLYKAYGSYCDKYNNKKMNQTSFGRKMGKRFHKNKAGRHTKYTGIELSNDTS